MLTLRRVLIIEDMFLIALDIQRVLEESHAAEAVFARDFEAARALSNGFEGFDLAIVNPPQPGDHGIAATLRTAVPGIIVCTATPIDLGATPLTGAEIILKPFSDEQLRTACQKAIAARSPN